MRRTREGELAPVLLTLGQSFLVGLPRVFTATAATTIFLQQFAAVELPYAYLLSGLLLAALGILYVRAERRFQLGAGVGTFVLLAAALFACRALLADKASVPLVAFGLILLAEAEFTLTNVTFWSLANRVFRPREAARAFGVISAGEVVPSVLGGLLIPLLVRKLAVADLLYLSAGAHLASAAYLVFLQRALRERLSSAAAPSREPKRRSRFRELLANRYLVLVAALLWLNVVVFYFVDNAFYGVVQRELSDPTTVADFLGGFFVALGVLNFIFKVVLSPRWRAWFGMRVALLTTPASLAVFCLIVLFVPAFGGGERLFAAIVMLKLMERLFIEGVHNPTYYALFQPLPLRVRTAAQNAIETVIAQGATLLAAGVLLALGRFQGTVIAATLVALSLGVLVVWLFVAFFAGREYSVRLEEALGQRLIEPKVLALPPGVEVHLERWLRSENVGQVLYGLELVREGHVAKLSAALEALLDHPQPAVVEAAAELLAAHAPRLACDRLLARLREGNAAPEAIRLAWLKALAGTGFPEATARLTELLGDASPGVRATAAARLLRSPEGRRLASPVIGVMARAADPAEREAAAVALGEVGEVLVGPLVPLLDDPAVSVRRAAIRTAGRSENPVVWPRIIAGLADPLLRPAAARALEAIGPKVAPALVQAVPGADGLAKRALLELAARLPTPETDALFETILATGDREAVLEALELLGETGRRSPPSWVGPLERRLAERIADHAGLWLALEAMRQEEDAELLVDALEGELARCARAVVSLLALLHAPELRIIGRQMQLGHTAEELGLSLEYLESVLPPEVVVRIRPVFDPLARRRAGGEEAPRLFELHRGDAPWLTAWIRGCAEEVQRARSTGSLSTSPGIERVSAMWLLPLFQGVHGASLGRLALRSHERRLAAGETLIERGQSSSSLFLLLHGTLQPEGGPPLKRGQAVGPYCLFQAQRSPARVAAATSARVLEVRSDELDALLREDFSLGWQLLVSLCRLLRPSAESGPPSRAEPPRGRAPEVESASLERMLAFRGAELFGGLEEGVLGALAEGADERCFQPGEVLIQEGELGTRMFVLAEGRARVEREGRTVATLAAPEILGELAALVPAPRSGTVRAELPTRALVVERATLFALLRSHPVVVRSTLQLLARRILASAASVEPGPAAKAS